jgi:hypothetical protein
VGKTGELSGLAGIDGKTTSKLSTGRITASIACLPFIGPSLESVAYLAGAVKEIFISLVSVSKKRSFQNSGNVKRGNGAETKLSNLYDTIYYTLNTIFPVVSNVTKSL